MDAEANDGINRSLKVLIVGCGLGGLACAIQCRREGLDVLVLEKASGLSEIGAGIQLPPNATRIMRRLGLLDKLYEAGMREKGGANLLRWQDGRVIGTRPGGSWAETMFGDKWHGIHRADYQRVMADEVKRLGVEIRFDCEVVNVLCHDSLPDVSLSNGERIEADVVVGADGLRSVIRTSVLGYVKEPNESGDLAYRTTLDRDSLEDQEFLENISTGDGVVYWGPNMHAVIYPISGGKQINVVLICPDDLSPEISKEQGDVEEMRRLFEKWDPRLGKLLDHVSKSLKWKIWTMDELDVWVKGSVALLGDACHPTVPYAAQGAAMAVEDGAVLGRLLGLFSRSYDPKTTMPDVLRLYQAIRKQRDTAIVESSWGNRSTYHMVDGPEQQSRDRLLAEHDWWNSTSSFPSCFADMPHLVDVLGFDAVQDADESFAERMNFL